MRRPRPVWRQVVVLAIGLASASASAQSNSTPATTTSVAKPDTKALKVLKLDEYGAWNRITSATISADGKWMSYAYQPNDGDATLYVKQLDGEKVYSFTIGSAPGGGGGGFGGGGAGGPQFSDDSRWVAYYVNPPARVPGARGGSGGGGGGRPGGAGAPPAGRGTQTGGAATPSRRFELLSLATGEKFPVPNAASFRFARGSRWLAVRLNRATPSDTSSRGADLVVRELATGTMRNLGNVNQYEFDDSGKYLAFTVDASERLGNGVYLLDPASGITQTLNSGAADYDQLVWSDAGTRLAALRGDKQRVNKQKDNVLLAWSDVSNATATKVEYDPAKDPAFPRGMVVSEFGAVRWSRDGSKIFVGLKEQEPETPRADAGEPQANVDVWHWKDPDPQSSQMLRVLQDRRASYIAALNVASKKLVQMADSNMRSVTPTPNGRWGIGRFDGPYRIENSWGWNNADYYRVDLESGERTLIAKKVARAMGVSPDSKWFLYLRDKHVTAYNIETGKTVVVDATAGKSFVDEDDDHAAEKPIYGVAGWSKDGKYLILNHKYDLWALPIDGGKAMNLTSGVGDAQEVQFRLVRFGQGGRGGRGGGGGGLFGTSGDDEGVDLAKPLTLAATGQWTKKTGYWQVPPGGAPKPLIWADKQIGGVSKADSADRLIFTQQTFAEFPDYWTSNAAFETPKKVTDANPQLAEYAWGSKVLVDYRNSKGKRLQATLTLPAGYEKGKKYPMLVYFYEIMSNTHHTFSMPVYDDRPHISSYASDGYLVLQPDVMYEIGKPGSSAVDCVTAAVKKVIELGYADPKHIGLQGHSWGGYQSSYIVTQTDMFAAVVTGAPLTNLISMYDELYKSTGTVNGGILETSQGRMGVDVTPWNAHDLYEQQSPVYNVRNIKTPFLILQGTADGAVDWNQGLEFYNAARRNGKQVIFLSYPDEPHHLAKKENQKDFQVRMKQYFDHYLKGTPAPKWMTDGVPQVRKGGVMQ
jgi:dienelactone hydrolase